MNAGLLPERIVPPAGEDRPEPSWSDFSWYICIAFDELSSLIHLPIDNVPGVPPPEDTPDEDPIDPRSWI
jgi:hypothetical protein